MGSETKRKTNHNFGEADENFPFVKDNLLICLGQGIEALNERQKKIEGNLFTCARNFP